MKFIHIALLTVTTLAVASLTNAAENPLLGTWKLKSYVRELTATGEQYNLFGDHPDGYLSYSQEGRMFTIITADKRITPKDPNPSDEEPVKLHQTMSSYAGTYTLDSDKVVHHVDISWNQQWNGTDQVRFYKLEGDKMTITSAPAKHPADGSFERSIIVWEKVKMPNP
jgi:hypothetical protein